MKKMKRFYALVLAFVLVLGMSMTTMAETTTYSAINIPINGAGNGTFAKLQLIEIDTTTDTGWKFSTIDIATDFKDALDASDDQTAIWMLIGNQDSRDDSFTAVLPTGVTAATDSQIAAALKNVKDGHTFSGHAGTVTADTPGVYYIDGQETDFVYSPMAAYVSFVYNKNSVPVELGCAGVTAKKVPTTISKDATSVEGADEITEIGREETYTVTSTVPFLPATDSNRTYQFIDELVGATYVSTADGKVDVNVVVGENLFVNDYTLDVTTTNGTSTFTLDLSTDLFVDSNNVKVNTYANQSIAITYKATVTDVVVHNDVYAGDGTTKGKDKYGSSNEDLFTGNITLTKYASDENNDDLADNKKLADATFKVYKTVSGTTSWATFDANNKFEDWVSAESSATPVTTGTDGTLTVYGLDAGTYYFKEVVAPTGYSINEEDVNATLALEDGETEATAVLTADTNMIDTKLLALPSTGGIGTTIFTVAGCAIMIAAVVLLLANRRKETK